MRLLLILLLMAGFTPCVRAQETPWPSPRAGHTMAWHDEIGVVVLYGGVLEGRDGDWLWSWDGLGWTVLDSLGPPTVIQTAMAYDFDRQTLVIHGGMGQPFDDNRPTSYGDTWEWKGSWKRIEAASPPPRDHHAMAYDRERKVAVVFGGARLIPDEAGELDLTLFDDTWTWDGTTWREHEVPGPPPRATHRMVWDDRTSSVLLFGGSGEEGPLADLWRWDGREWTLLDEGSGPAARMAARIAWDAARGELVLYGGRGDTGDFDDTWIWNGNAWTRRDVEGPGPLNVHEMAYDSNRKTVILFGGFHRPDYFAGLWGWDGEQWEHYLPD